MKVKKKLLIKTQDINFKPSQASPTPGTVLNANIIIAVPIIVRLKFAEIFLEDFSLGKLQ